MPYDPHWTPRQHKGKHSPHRLQAAYWTGILIRALVGFIAIFLLFHIPIGMAGVLFVMVLLIGLLAVS